jgi:hypothetical protein
MRAYRLYFRSFEGGIERRHDFAADDDAAAVRIAARRRNGHTIELWEGARMVRQWPANHRPVPDITVRVSLSA